MAILPYFISQSFTGVTLVVSLVGFIFIVLFILTINLLVKIHNKIIPGNIVRYKNYRNKKYWEEIKKPKIKYKNIFIQKFMDVINKTCTKIEIVD